MIIIMSIAGVVIAELLVEIILAAVLISNLCKIMFTNIETFLSGVSITQGIIAVLIEIT